MPARPMARGFARHGGAHLGLPPPPPRCEGSSGSSSLLLPTPPLPWIRVCPFLGCLKGAGGERGLHLLGPQERLGAEDGRCSPAGRRHPLPAGIGCQQAQQGESPQGGQGAPNPGAPSSGPRGCRPRKGPWGALPESPPEDEAPSSAAVPGHNWQASCFTPGEAGGTLIPARRWGGHKALAPSSMPARRCSW